MQRLDDPDDRASEAKKMLEWGYRNFETRTLLAADQTLGYARVFGGATRGVFGVALYRWVADDRAIGPFTSQDLDGAVRTR